MLVAAADLFFLQPFPHLKALIVLLPGNGIAESFVAHRFNTHQMQVPFRTMQEMVQNFTGSSMKSVDITMFLIPTISSGSY